jgi:tRNA(Ile)-lysidine synthase
MSGDLLRAAVATVPSGAWAVAVSGGADSVALLSLLVEHRRDDVSLHVVHLDHQTRGDASTGDAKFVADLAASLNLPCAIARRDEVEPTLVHPPANTSALYRAVRLALFRRVVAENGLLGVILAHHADDQAETVFQRLLRGSGYAGLAGMSATSFLGDLTILRPLLSVTRAQISAYLARRKIAWREDASNQSDKYLRNRLRVELAEHPAIAPELIRLGDACRELRDWARSVAPVLEAEFFAAKLAGVDRLLAEEAAKRWLIESAGVPVDELTPATIERLLTMASDAASPPRQDLPGRITIRRRRGKISATPRQSPQ